MMNGQLGTPLAPELAVFALAILVLVAGIIRPGRAIGWIAFVGLLAIFGMMHYASEGQVLFGGAFVQDALALFAKRLFIAAIECRVADRQGSEQTECRRRDEQTLCE